MGLKRRVSAGFLGIVVVLILSGMVSFYELNVLSNETEDILGTNRKYRDVAAKITAALRDQNRAFVQMTAYDDRSYDSICDLASTRIDRAIVEARANTLVPDVVDSLDIVASQLNAATHRFINISSVKSRIDFAADSLLVELPTTKEIYAQYMQEYDRMVIGIDRYYTESQRTLSPGSEKLHNNAYRAVTPVFISLTVMIVIVLMLFYFMVLYCVTPVVNMNKSLKDFLAYKIPFAPKGERHDEMQELYDGIEALVKQSNKIQKE